MRDNHDQRAVWIDGNGTLILEKFHPASEAAQDSLIAIAEPLSRPEMMQEYKLTVHSLYAAVSSGLGPDIIIAGLKSFTKNLVPPNTCSSSGTAARATAMSSWS
ncbi:hypothetical protein C8A00DRAFT_31879 [Chaetomidium leptoderma]|uniref:Helicase XPB/Ssl2 N-terminal domain-containing protein n=1 Tax=Chaetomidium leptoderma TaxID=669021 RepID=A0AAN6VQY6_9PEZI|nr:hypothetical protein C8A00DRAFT_31879 [Chaetomidium leptoderma]